MHHRRGKKITLHRNQISLDMRALFAREGSRAPFMSTAPLNSQILPPPHAQKSHTLSHAVSFVLPVFNLMITAAAGEALVTADVNAAVFTPPLHVIKAVVGTSDFPRLHSRG